MSTISLRLVAGVAGGLVLLAQPVMADKFDCGEVKKEQAEAAYKYLYRPSPPGTVGKRIGPILPDEFYAMIILRCYYGFAPSPIPGDNLTGAGVP